MNNVIKYKTKLNFIADGENCEFNFNFQIFGKENVTVYLDDVLKTDGFSVKVDENGGAILFDVAPAKDIQVTVIRNLPIKRVTDFQEGGPFRAARVNGEFDYQVACLEQFEEKLSRVIYKPPYLIEDSNLSLPEPISGRTLIWSADNTGLKNSRYDVDNLESQLSNAVKEVNSKWTDVLDKTKIVSDIINHSIPNSHTLGEIFTDGFVELLDGQGWCQGDILPSAAYAGLVAEFEKYKADNSKGIVWIDFATYDATLTENNGNCILFGYDTVNSLIRLPTIGDEVVIGQAKSSIEQNKWKQDQIQNITGKSAGSVNVTPSGAFAFSAPSVVSFYGGSNGDIRPVNFDASRVARTGVKTRTEMVLRRYKVQLANVAVQASESNYVGFINGLTNKTDKNGGNLSSNEAKGFNRKLGLNPQYVSPEFYYNTLGAVISYDTGIIGLTDIERMSLRTAVVAICKTANNGYAVGDVICNPTLDANTSFGTKADAVLMANGLIWTEVTHNTMIELRGKGVNTHASISATSASNLWAFRMIVY